MDRQDDLEVLINTGGRQVGRDVLVVLVVDVRIAQVQPEDGPDVRFRGRGERVADTQLMFLELNGDPPREGTDPPRFYRQRVLHCRARFAFSIYS